MSGYPTARAVSKPAGRDRVVVNGVDITVVNDKTTPTPAYRLTEPLGYGSSTLVVPGINPLFVEIGGPSCRWAVKKAQVKYQRVDPTTLGVLATDYRGEVIDIKISGSQLVLEVGGLVAGPAELLLRNPVPYRKVLDIGRMVDTFMARLNVPFTPHLGPDTGIEMVATGGMSGLAYLQMLCSMAQKRNGDQWTLMPVVPGGKKFEFRLKDRDTIHATIWLDGSRAVPDLVDEPVTNVWYGETVTPDGYIERGLRVPGGVQGTPPDYPMIDGSSFGVGTVDADTDAIIDGVTTLHRALEIFDYISLRDITPGEYTNKTADAVERLQEDGNLPETGVMNQATWNRLFDLDVTGYDLEGARLFPILEDKRVRKWNYTPTGNKAGRNPDYDPTVQRVERWVNFGPGWTMREMRDWCRAQNKRVRVGKNWVGSVTLNQVGAFAGEHPVDATPTEADILSLRDLQPGWNYLVHNVAGESVVMHAADVQVDPGGGTAVLSLDCQARDAMEVAEIRRRNQESRNDPRRQHRNEHRRGQLRRDNSSVWERQCGLLPHDVHLTADTWTVVKVFAGQQGRVGMMKSITKNVPAGFTVVVFGRKVTRGQLQNRIPNPRAVNDKGETPWETSSSVDAWFENRDVLMIAGSGDNPCGYGRRRHKNDKGEVTDAPLVGWWVNHTGFEYITRDEPVLYVAYHADRDTVLESGRIMWKQAEDAA